MDPLALAVLLWGCNFVIFLVIKFLINGSLLSEKKRRKDGPEEVNEGVDESNERIHILRTLEILIRVIEWSLAPLIAVVVGNLLPSSVRQFLGAHVPPSALVCATLAALFAHIAIVQVWRTHMEIDTSLFRPKEQSESKSTG